MAFKLPLVTVQSKPGEKDKNPNERLIEMK